MVDFNSEGTVTTAPADVLKILILEKREYVMEAITNYNIVKFKDMNARDNYVKAGIMTLWIELNAMLLNSVLKKEKMSINNKEVTLSDDYLKTIYAKINSDNWSDAFEFLNSYLYMKGLTRVDTRSHYDKSRVSAINRQKGL